MSAARGGGARRRWAWSRARCRSLRVISRVLMLILLPLAAGCDSIAYYRQAIGGQLEIMSAARPVEAWLADPATPAALRERLEAARRIRQFASHGLGLPDNRSYAAYAELGRPFAAWNVFAAPEFSVEPTKESLHFPGCVSCRSFFA